MDIDRVGIEGNIDATAMLELTVVAQRLGLRVFRLIQTEEDAAKASSRIDWVAIDREGDETPPSFMDSSAKTDALTANEEPGVCLETPITIRRPIDGREFMDYAATKLKSTGDRRTDQARRGAITRTWNGLLSPYRTKDDLGRKPQTEGLEGVLGVKMPTFNTLVYKDTRGYHPRKTTVKRLDTEKTNGLDMDQTARFLIAISRHIEQHRRLPRHAFKAEIHKILPFDRSWVGLTLLCSFIIDTASVEGGLPSDIKLDNLEQAKNVFEGLILKT